MFGGGGLAPFDGGASLRGNVFVHLSLRFDQIVIARAGADKEVRGVKRQADAAGQIVNAKRLGTGVFGECGNIGGAVALLDKGGFERTVARNQIEECARGLVNGPPLANGDLEWFP